MNAIILLFKSQDSVVPNPSEWPSTGKSSCFYLENGFMHCFLSEILQGGEISRDELLASLWLRRDPFWMIRVVIWLLLISYPKNKKRRCNWMGFLSYVQVIISPEHLQCLVNSNSANAARNLANQGSQQKSLQNFDKTFKNPNESHKKKYLDCGIKSKSEYNIHNYNNYVGMYVKTGWRETALKPVTVSFLPRCRKH